MEPKDNNIQTQQGKHEHPLPHQISDGQRQQNEDAHDQADKDMEQDPELTAGSPNDDLDEGETARLGEDISDVI